jgi:ferrochelatase
MSHGTPRSFAQIPAFYTEIRRGRPPPPDLLADLERRYREIGGVSPLNAVTDAQVDRLRRALEARAPGDFVVAAGAKFAPPRIEDAVGCLAHAGVERVTGVVLAPHFSVASVGDYPRRAEAAAEAAGRALGRVVTVEMIRQWHLEPGFVTLVADRVRRALSSLPEAAQRDPVVVFTAHSIPARLVDAGDPYARQVDESAAAVARAAGVVRWSVAWQSAGRTDEAWLGPDVRDVVAELGDSGATGVVVCPIGFVSDHLEVLYDIDIEVQDVARRVGLPMARTESLNDDPALGDVLAQVVMDAVGTAPA